MNGRDRLPPDDMLDEYVDCAGKRRSFRLALHANGTFLEARELRDGEPVGLRFVLPVRPGDIPPRAEIRKRIWQRLAQRHLVRDARGNLELLHDVIRGQLIEDDGATPSLLVDDVVLTWDELGALLSPFVGFGLRIEVHEAGEE